MFVEAVNNHDNIGRKNVTCNHRDIDGKKFSGNPQGDFENCENAIILAF